MKSIRLSDLPFRHHLLLAVMVLFISCSTDNPDGIIIINDSVLSFILEDEVQPNPSGYAPLSAKILVETSENTRVTMRVLGKNGAKSDVVKAFDALAQNHEIAVHGLYANTNNLVELTFYNASNTLMGTQQYQIQTAELITDMPLINIEQAKQDKMAPGMTLVSYFGHAGNALPQRPFIFDSYGDIRWYLDFSASPTFGQLFYDDGMERLANGNFYFGFGNFLGGDSPNANIIYEIDMFGTILNSWDMPGYGFHHEVHEKPNGNFLISVNKLGAATIEDYIIEIDRTTGEIINEWNLNESLDNTRKTLTNNIVDWIHVNAVTYDPLDNSIIVSRRTQGVIKLSNNNEVIWIMSAHKDWGTSGKGIDLNQFLLQPLDAMGNPINDSNVLNGDVNHPDFEWNWYQHAPQIKADGNIFIFDNGDNRNFVGNNYSRAVEYKIDEVNRTIQQTWQYGKEREGETYSRIVSDVDFLEANNNVLFSAGAVVFNGAEYGKAIEVDHTTKEVLFEATIVPPIAIFAITFHRTERLPLYPESQ
ncbi:MAG: aryl-sulfate sulfotransferase [Croceitalea sp.]|nr:aryl-sulfate sulfotransferase [Croceitalea sp.]